jgi:hypothetical protein
MLRQQHQLPQHHHHHQQQLQMQEVPGKEETKQKLRRLQPQSNSSQPFQNPKKKTGHLKKVPQLELLQLIVSLI